MEAFVFDYDEGEQGEPKPFQFRPAGLDRDWLEVSSTIIERLKEVELDIQNYEDIQEFEFIRTYSRFKPPFVIMYLEMRSLMLLAIELSSFYRAYEAVKQSWIDEFNSLYAKFESGSYSEFFKINQVGMRELQAVKKLIDDKQLDIN